MGDTLGLPRINEIAAYINDFAPAAKVSLSKSDPHAAGLLESGYIAGDEKASDEKLRQGLIARAQVLDAALGEAIAQSKDIIDRISKKMDALKKIRFSSLVCGAVGSSSVMATAFIHPIAALISGMLALVSSIAGIAADNLILGPKINEDQLREAGSTLLKVISQGDLTRRLLAALQAIDFDPGELKSVIADANALFAELINARSTANNLK